MNRVGGKLLFGIFLACAAISTVLLAWTKSKGAYPMKAPVVLIIVLVVVAAVAAFLGWRVRKWVRTGQDFDPIGATRTLALGQSAALVGPMLGGYFIAQIIISLTDLPAPEPAKVISVAAFAFGAAVALTAAGLFAQWCCKVPPSDDDHNSGNHLKHS